RIINVRVTYELGEGASENHAFTIMRGEEILGLLKLEKPFDRFSHMDQIAIEQASLSIALELIKNNALFEKEIHFREEVFNQIMEGISGRDLQHALNYVKWDESWHVRCIILEGKDHPLWQPDKLIDKERFVQTIEQITDSFGLHSFILTRA